MIQDADLFVSLAEIAGVFVGFGALISFSSRSEIDALELGRIRAVVSIGLVVIVSSLIPVSLARYGVTGHALWSVCSAIFLVLIWFIIFLSLWTRESREQLIAEAQNSPVLWTFFWLFLEVPIQLPLVLVLLGSFPDLEPAFYTTALVINLVEAAFVLAQVVFSQTSQSTGN